MEKELVDKHAELQIPCERVPLSGRAGGAFAGDLHIRADSGPPLQAEVKSRKGGHGFTTLERWLGENDLLFLRRNHAEPMVVLPWATYARLIQK